ncbi:hypothetical protein Calkr_0948 [Caldicellulosiruptor acetigenus I77R1B]|uniref:Adhesin domain-containing protein n=1 Tax=Caldicellulosiruptor acetigenus (strain ATCC 700853 / DSM 12137 / I77R1B) TaxID=632335 RepID=E4S508_CALA7|nr:hypothetical protein [Caldicellulosiruptor acetigenus]ADQ40462.1 hypothetical protein Calkr_0948 [Caldicellulosiruptor acetigenus I77R1B]
MHFNQNVLGLIGLLMVLFFIGLGLFYLISKDSSNIFQIKKFHTSQTVRLVLSLLSILFAWIFPWTALKILFVLSCILFLLSIFPIKKTSFGMVIAVALVTLVIIGSIISQLHYYSSDKQDFKFSGLSKSISQIISDVITSSDFIEVYRSITYSADQDMSIENFDEIVITCSGGIDLELIDDEDTIYFPSVLKTKVSGKTLKVFNKNTESNTTYEIKLGTKSLRDVKVSCRGLKIRGNGKFKNLAINSTGSFIQGQIEATNDISIDCAGFDLRADLKGKTLKIDSSGTNINSQLIFDKIEIDSAGLNIRAKARFEDFDINAAGLSGSIDILNSENEKGVLNIEATGGIIKINNPYNAPVTTKTSGYVKLIRE